MILGWAVKGTDSDLLDSTTLRDRVLLEQDLKQTSYPLFWLGWNLEDLEALAEGTKGEARAFPLETLSEVLEADASDFPSQA